MGGSDGKHGRHEGTASTTSHADSDNFISNEQEVSDYEFIINDDAGNAHGS